MLGGVLDPKLKCYTHEDWLHLNSYINAQNNRCRYQRQTFGVHIRDQKLVCGVTLLVLILFKKIIDSEQ
jgi:hypothetical protein